MRDTFRKELHKLPKTRSGQEGGLAKESKWPYFQNMLFLKDQFTGRKLQSSILETEINAEPGIDDEVPDDDFVVGTTENVAVDQNAGTAETEHTETGKNSASSHFTCPPSKRVKTVKSNAIQQLLVIEQEKLNQFKERSEAYNQAKIKEDADYHFLMSLLPYLRKVPEERKLIVRTKLQQVFCDEQALTQQQPYDNGFNSYSQQPSPLNSNSSAGLPQHPTVNCVGSPNYTNLSAPDSREIYTENSVSSPEFTTLSGPSSEESSIPKRYSGLASYFAQINPQT